MTEVFDTRLEAITFYHGVYEYTVKFRLIALDLYIEQLEDKYLVIGSIDLLGQLYGVSENDIISHIKNKI